MKCENFKNNRLHMKAGAEWKHKNGTYPQKMQAFMP
ncbi:hypothetical protein T09_12761 [Trichinella sp. T9]|nr:hypothetical protein T09_12761 [Trichinella sp. T9]